jgi:Glycosyl transferases group 1
MNFLNIAPHCTLPPLDGADRRAWCLYEAVIQAGQEGIFVSRSVEIKNLNEPKVHSRISDWRQKKLITALASILSGSDYWQMKMLHPGIRQALSRVRNLPFNAVIVNFLYCTSLLQIFRGRRLKLIIDTHNYDPNFFDALATAKRNPLFRRLCQRAIQTSRRALQSLPGGTIMVHVSEADAEAYRKDRPDLRHVVIENGCRLAPRVAFPKIPEEGKKQLLFVASLSAQMNQDALLNFQTHFWPKLSELADLTVAGSNPPPALAAQCLKAGWKLRPNITDEELTELYSTAHCAIAPFAYGAGSKLKLLEACGRGVSVLATTAAICGLTLCPPCVYVSDNPNRWREIVTHIDTPSTADLKATIDFAAQFSWRTLGERMARVLEEAPYVDIP